MSEISPRQGTMWRWLIYAIAIGLILFTLLLEFFRWFFNLFSPDRISAASHVRNAQLAPFYRTREQMFDAVDAMKYGRYGMTSFGARPQADGSTLYAAAVEVPRTREDRYVVYREQDGGFRLVDDFICSEDCAISDVDLEDGRLVYKDFSGAAFLRRPLLSEQAV